VTRTKQHNIQCLAKTKAGKPCQAAATSGGLCFFHANPRLASKLGRKGGSRRKKIIPTQPLAALGPFDSITALRELNYRLIQEVYAGELDPQRAKGIAALLTLQTRLIDFEGLENRLEMLEAFHEESKRFLQDAPRHSREN